MQQGPKAAQFSKLPKNECGSKVSGRTKMQFTQGKCLLQRSCEGDVWSPINGNDNERHSWFIGAGKAYPIQTTFTDLLLGLYVGAALIAADILPAVLWS